MNQVEETIRILDAHIQFNEMCLKEYEAAYNEFSRKCANVLEEKNFETISGTLLRLIKMAHDKSGRLHDEKITILNKYDIPYLEKSDGDG